MAQIDNLHRVRMTARHAGRVIVVAPVRRCGGARRDLVHVSPIRNLLHGLPPSRPFEAHPVTRFVEAMKVLPEEIPPWKPGHTSNHVRKRRPCPTSHQARRDHEDIRVDRYSPGASAEVLRVEVDFRKNRCRPWRSLLGKPEISQRGPHSYQPKTVRATPTS